MVHSRKAWRVVGPLVCVLGRRGHVSRLRLRLRKRCIRGCRRRHLIRLDYAHGSIDKHFLGSKRVYVDDGNGVDKLPQLQQRRNGHCQMVKGLSRQEQES
jgi:hypothetical protein